MLLIDMRKEAFRLHRGCRQVLCLGQWLHERPNVRNDSEITRRPERLPDPGNAGCNPYWGARPAAANGRSCDLRQREIAARPCVIGVARGVQRYDHVIGVIPAVEEYANKGFIIVGPVAARVAKTPS